MGLLHLREKTMLLCLVVNHVPWCSGQEHSKIAADS